MTEGPRVAILIPCYDEAPTIGDVVESFRAELPDADIRVYDNDSTDDTAQIAREAGATVVREKRRGKGFVARTMFSDVDADIYVMVDGDGTYPADHVHDLIEPVAEGRADVVVGNRLTGYADGAYRPFHVMGNRMVVTSINLIFGSNLQDVMSGYRCMSRAFVRSIPILARGFELETDLTVQALYRHAVIEEVPIPYGARPEGSYSKLSTVGDGARVLIRIVDLFKAYRPLLFFGLLAFVLGASGFALGAWPVVELVQTNALTRPGSLLGAIALEMLALASLVCGVVLDATNHHFREVSQLILQSR